MRNKFTLIEIIAVIAVFGILLAVVIPNVSDKKETAMITQVKSNLSNMQTAMDMYSYDNNGEFASIVQPTLEEPQMVSFDMLYPKYLKSLPENILGEYYWVDFMGKVWGSTVDAPIDVFSSEISTEWISNNSVSSYNVYQVSNIKNLGSIKNNKVIFKKNIINYQDIDKFVSKTNEKLLVSSVDKFGLETAPVGTAYKGIPEDWFTPIINKEGTFEFNISSEELMYWDGFYTKEEKPDGTEIKYEFSVTDSNGDNLPFTEDFYSLKSSKSITMRITMVGNSGKLPSLLDFRVYYHFANEDELYKKPDRIVQDNIVKDIVVLQPNEIIESIVFPDNIGGKPILEYSPDGVTYSPVGSLTDIPKDGGYVSINRDFSENKGNGINPPIISEIKSPIIKVTISNPNVQDIEQQYVPKDDSVSTPSKPNDSVVTEEGWDTVQEIVFVASTSDGQEAHWISADIEDKQPENTRILYRYSIGNGFTWGSYVDDFSKLTDSKMLKVYCILQVKKEFADSVENPEVISITINSSKGVIDLNTVKPTGMVKLIKDNNGTREVISTTSNIKWEYEAYDPQSKKITEVVWGGDKRANYDTPGTYTVTLKLKNELNYWSDEIKYTFEVVEDKPVAIITPNQEQFSNKMPIKWNYNESYDIDDDGIVSVEWGGDYKTTTYEAGTYIIKMRVKDLEENWSNWTTKTFQVIDGIFYNVEQSMVDKDINTFASISSNNPAVVKWVEDLSNQAISLTYQINSNNNKDLLKLEFLNETGNAIPFQLVDSETKYTTYTSPTGIIKRTIQVVVPEDAVSMKIFNGGGIPICVYEIEESSVKTLPDEIKNISHTSNSHSISLSWDKPNGDYSKVAIFRDGTFISYSNGIEYTDTPLYEAQEYTYKFISIGSTGNRSLNSVTYKARTIKDGVVFSGGKATMFDNDLSTFGSASSNNPVFITWDEDLSNKVISLTYQINNNRNIDLLRLEFLNEEGNAIPFQLVDSETKYTTYTSPTGITKRTIQVVVPEDAVSMKIFNGGGIPICVYEIQEGSF